MVRRKEVSQRDMKKDQCVGIVTYQYADNYGAVLQCLALQRVLEEIGATVSVINYRPPVLPR